MKLDKLNLVELEAQELQTINGGRSILTEIIGFGTALVGVPGVVAFNIAYITHR